jgi:hypothetical protein
MYKVGLFTLLIILSIQLSFAQSSYWQQQVNYTIDVSLNDNEHSLTGFTTIEYINNSPDTLRFLWVHLWINAFKNDKTAFSEQQLSNGNTSFYFSNESQKGYINRLNFQEKNQTLQVDDHPNFIDIVKINLSQPLLPGQKTKITTPFYAKIPYNFSRGGHINQEYQITQWYPKIAMYDATGWHPMPYVDQGEFYSNFGDYIVNITLPQNYAVAATGALQNEDEQKWLAQRVNFKLPKTEVPKNSTQSKVVSQKIKSAASNKTLTFIQNKVTDFAWFASKEFVVLSDTLALPNGKTFLCQSFYHPKEQDTWKSSLSFLKRSILFRSALIGDYPYTTATIVNSPMGFSGGMEYPTITSIAGNYTTKQLDIVIQHEIGHNWFQGVLATNERIHPWLDEGLNTFYDNKYEAIYYPTTKPNYNFITKLSSSDFIEKLWYLLQKDQPINTNSYNFTSSNYGLIAYNKTANWLNLIETNTSTAIIEKSIKEYYKQWKFKHPSPQDFDTSMIKNISNYKQYVNQRNSTGPLTKNNNSLQIITPIIGYNTYNKLMLGVSLLKTFPKLNDFVLFAAPLYSFKTNTLNGLARAHYNYFPNSNKIQKINYGVSLAKFQINTFENINLQMKKIDPYVRIHFKHNKPRSTVSQHITIRHLNIAEDNLQFRVIQTPSDTFFQPFKQNKNRYLNQFQWSYFNDRVLYPFNAQLLIEQNNDILRSTITANQYFNYNASGQGLSVRLFVGKLSYLKTNNSTIQFNNDKYVLNLIAPKGNEDYTYSNYFIGRNDFEKTFSKQILQRDGFFKFRTDLLANKPGRTDKWLASTNFVTDIPNKLNPLSILPIKIPIKFFMDLGTFAEAWDKKYDGSKFLYSGGLQISLFKNTLEIYYPFINSRVFKDYSLQIFQKKNSYNNISFAINLNTFNINKVIPQLIY